MRGGESNTGMFNPAAYLMTQMIHIFLPWKLIEERNAGRYLIWNLLNAWISFLRGYRGKWEHMGCHPDG